MPDAEPSPEIKPQGPGIVNADLANEAVRRLGPDSAWLIFAITLYGWRAYYDLAIASVTGETPTRAKADAFPWPPSTEYQAVLDLHTLGLTYMAAELFLRLLRACRYYRVATVLQALGIRFEDEPFLAAYMSHGYVAGLIREAQHLDRSELVDLMRASEVRAIALEKVAERKRQEPVKADMLKQLLGSVTDLGGLLVPASAITQGIPESADDQANELVDLFVRNIEQLRALTEDPARTSLEAAPEPQPMREVDNAYRHGLRVLYGSAMPERRHFASVEPEAAALSAFAVDVLLPRAEGRVAYGTVDASPQRTMETLESLRQICTRTGQLARTFLGAQVLDNAGLTFAALSLELPPVPKLDAQRFETHRT